MAKGKGFQRKSGVSSEIPSSSLADIAFLLLIFFMVTTVFQADRDRPIAWPEAGAAEKIDEKQKNILNIWLERSGQVYMNDQPFAMEDVSSYVAPLYAASDRALVISIPVTSNDLPRSMTIQGCSSMAVWKANSGPSPAGDSNRS